jgi:uncharacterized protein YceH (UPF0502 family)
MSSEPTPPSTGTPAAWPVLTPHERRVLGVLAEKQKMTPDTYPMSLNALVTGCNQKSNREPVLNLSDDQVEEALAGAQKKGLAFRLTGSGRVEKWRHGLYEAWHVGKAEMAVLVELLLRGPQTEGELRGRVSRMEPVEDLDALRVVLKPLAERRLVVYLTPEGRRGTVLTHGFHPPEELQRLRAAQPVEVPAAPPPPAAPPAPTAAAPELEGRLKGAETALAALQAAVADLGEQVRKIKEALGL